LFRNASGTLSAAKRSDALNTYTTHALARFAEYFTIVHKLDEGRVGYESSSTDNILYWTALARHYSMPNPVLDWSLSPWVSIFMAVADWRPKFGDSMRLFRLNKEYMPHDSIKIYQPRGTFLGRRYFYQSGAFLYTYNSKKRRMSSSLIDEHKFKNIGDFIQFVDIKVGEKNKGSMLKTLSSMGISHHVLFPDSIEKWVEDIKLEFSWL
jgi:FRG domain